MVLVGARSHRQGTGPFIAAGLARSGASISGIVGTSEASVAQALSGLERDWGIASKGYTDLAIALQNEQADAVAICSPWRFHAEQLQQVAEAGCHCLVEKPLAWPADDDTINRLLQAYEQHGLLLQMVTQWPTTLPAFNQLHGRLPETIESFTMRLSPISIGADMITDSAPHFISMLQALAGPGEFTDCATKLDNGTDEPTEARLLLNCQYQHQTGSIRAQLILQTCQQRPRPAWFQVNELRADREVELPDYQQYLVAAGRRVALTDPMHQVTAKFIRAIHDNAKTDTETLSRGHSNLQQLDTAWNNTAASTVVVNSPAP